MITHSWKFDIVKKNFSIINVSFPYVCVLQFQTHTHMRHKPATFNCSSAHSYFMIWTDALIGLIQVNLNHAWKSFVVKNGLLDERKRDYQRETKRICEGITFVTLFCYCSATLNGEFNKNENAIVNSRSACWTNYAQVLPQYHFNHKRMCDLRLSFAFVLFQHIFTSTFSALKKKHNKKRFELNCILFKLAYVIFFSRIVLLFSMWIIFTAHHVCIW